MSLHLAAYDVSSDKRRRRLARVLERFGTRVQFSVFEVWLEPKMIPRFRLAVGAHLGKTDRFDLYPVDERGNRRRTSWQRAPVDYSPVLVIDSPEEAPWPPAGSKPLKRSDWSTSETFAKSAGSEIDGW
jgi:CRISPR-associated protein Cas2